MKKIENDVGKRQGLRNCKSAYVFPGFAVQDSQSQPLVELGFFERAPAVYPEVEQVPR